MLKTYTLYLCTDDDGRLDFEHAMVDSTQELVARAHELLERRPGFHSVNVCFGDEEMFSVRKPGS